MQEQIKSSDSNGMGHNPSVTDFRASDFTAMNAENQMLFMASTLVGVSNNLTTVQSDVANLQSDVTKLKKGQTKLKAAHKATDDQVSALSAKFDGFDYKLEGQNAKIEGQNERISNASSRTKLWIIGATSTLILVVSQAWEWIPEVFKRITQTTSDATK